MKLDTDILYGPEGPTEKQKEFRDLGKAFKLFGGGVGSGKTWTLCAEALRVCLLWPGNRFYLCRQDGVVFKNTTLVTLLELISSIERWLNQRIIINHNQTKQVIHLTRGSVIMYGGLSKSERRNNVKSLELGGFGIDEASEVTEANFFMLKARLRWVLPSGLRPKYIGLLASNPENCWLIPQFVEDETRPEDYGYIMSLTKDNPRLDESYEKDLRKSNPANWVEQYLDGKWRFSEGRVWPEFDPDIHVLPNKYVAKYPRMPIAAQFILGIDHGQRHPTVALAAYRDKDGNVFLYDEYYAVGVVSQHCRNIVEQFPIKRFEMIILDKAAWNQNMEKFGELWSVAQEYAEHKIPASQADNAVSLGLAKVASHLYVDPEHKHPVTGKLGAPRLYIDGERCPNTVRQVQGYVRMKNRDGEYQDKPRKHEDDTCDALRYLLMGFGSIQPKEVIYVASEITNPRYKQLMQIPDEEILVW